MKLARSPVESRLLSARRKLAAGGAIKAVRNFLSKVNGSGFEAAMNDLKSRVLGNDQDPVANAQRALSPENQAALDPEVQKNIAIDRWIDRNLRNYIVKQHGTENDPLRQVLEQQYESAGTGHGTQGMARQMRAQEVPAVTHDLGWYHTYLPNANDENLIHDGGLNGQGDLDPKSWQAQNYPQWLKDAIKKDVTGDQPVLLHDLDLQAYRSHFQRPLADTLDYLRANVDPKSLPQVSVPDAVRKSQEWHAAMAKKAADANRELIDSLPVTKQYANGAKWVSSTGDINYDDPTERDAWQSIGKALGHCYQNPATCEEYLSNSTLHTLIDPSGKPRVTVEVAPMSAGQRGVYQADAQGNQVNEIAQVRGPQNDVAPEDALPYLKDFIASGRYGSVPSDVARQLGIKKFTTQGGFPLWASPDELPGDFARYRMFNGDEAQLLPADDFVKQMAETQIKSKLAARGLANAQNAQAAINAARGPAEANVRALLQQKAPDFYNIPDDWQPPSSIPQDKAGGRVGYAGGGLVDDLSRLWSEIRGTVDGGADAERMLPRYGSMAKQITRRSLSAMPERVASDLQDFGIRPPERAQQTVENMLINDSGLANAGALTSSGLEISHQASDANDNTKRTVNAYGDTIDQTEAEFGIPTGLLHSLIHRESNFDPSAVSKKGALGIAQFMPQTAADLGIDPTDPNQAIPAAGEYLRELYEKTGNWRDALASYNWGVNNVLKYGYDHAPAETKKYVNSIIGQDSAGRAIASAKRQLTAQNLIANRGVVPAASAVPALPAPAESQDDQSQAVPRGTDLSVAKRLTGLDSSSRMLSELDPSDALGLILMLDEGDEKDSDGLLGLLALLEGNGAGGATQAAK